MVKTLHSQCKGAPVRSLVRELRSHKPHDVAKINKLIIIIKKHKGRKHKTKKWQPVDKCLKIELTTLACHFSLSLLEIFHIRKG